MLNNHCLRYVYLLIYIVCLILVDSSSVEQLDRPLLKDIMMEYGTSERMNDLECKWEQIGIQLEVADEELQHIRVRYTSQDHCDDTLAFQELIRVWIKQESPPPTWLRFVEALERLKINPKLADHLRSKYCT